MGTAPFNGIKLGGRAAVEPVANGRRRSEWAGCERESAVGKGTLGEGQERGCGPACLRKGYDRHAFANGHPREPRIEPLGCVLQKIGWRSWYSDSDLPDGPRLGDPSASMTLERTLFLGGKPVFPEGSGKQYRRLG